MGDGSRAHLVTGIEVRSLEQLERQHGPFAAVVVAAGAAAGTIQEVAELNPPLKICQGYSLFLSPGHAPTDAEQQQQHPRPGQRHLPHQPPTQDPEEEVQALPLPYPEGAPSILGQVYMAAHGTNRLVVGATRSYGWTAEDALGMCRAQSRGVAAAGPTSANGAELAADPPATSQSSGNLSGNSNGSKSKRKGRANQPPKNSAAAVAAAEQELMQAVSAHWPPVAGWRVDEVRSGMRGLPPRTAAGAIPLAGRLREGRPWWLMAGLGARGLVYHAWLAQVMAAAVVGDDERLVQPEALLAWKAAGAAGQPVVFDQP